MNCEAQTELNLFVRLSNYTVALALQYDDNDLVVAHFSSDTIGLESSSLEIKMSARAWKLSSSVGLEAPTTDVSASSVTFVLTSHDGGNHVTADCSSGRKSSLVSLQVRAS